MSLEETIKENVAIIIAELDIAERVYDRLAGEDADKKDITRFREVISSMTNVENQPQLIDMIPTIREISRFITGILLDGGIKADEKLEGGGEMSAQEINDLSHDFRYSFTRLAKAREDLIKAIKERENPRTR